MACLKWHLNYANAHTFFGTSAAVLCILSVEKYDDRGCALFAIQLRRPKKPDFFMLIHREVAVHTNERGEKSVPLCAHV